MKLSSWFWLGVILGSLTMIAFGSMVSCEKKQIFNPVVHDTTFVHDTLIVHNPCRR